MPFAKLTDAIYDSESCCAYDFLTTNHTIKKAAQFTDASDRAIKKWRRGLREGRYVCENNRECKNCQQKKES